jgi:hypothetical protein
LSTPFIFRLKATLSMTEMRKQRVALEHHRGAALCRRQVGDVVAVQNDIAVVTVSCPAIMRSVEDLPHPDGPSKAGIGAVVDLLVDRIDGERGQIDQSP